MAKKIENIPHFASEAAEREFWQKNDSSSYLDCSQAKPVRFTKLKPSREQDRTHIRAAAAASAPSFAAVWNNPEDDAYD